jgi:solute carrier family 25 (mitochondrial folate transporter), member 32
MLVPYVCLFFRCSSTHLTRDVMRVGSALPSSAQYMLASIGAGAVNVAVTNPLWVVKTRLQTQDIVLQFAPAKAHRYNGTFHALRKIAMTEGHRGLYAGLAPSLMGIAHVAIQFPLYEKLKKVGAEWRGVDPASLAAGDLMVLSSAAKAVASTATYPHEVVRSHMHVTGAGAFSGFGTICYQVRASGSCHLC